MPSVKEELTGLRGQDYYARFTELFEEIAPDFERKINNIKRTALRFTLGDLVTLVDEYDLPFKPTVLALEKRGVLRSGTWDVWESDGINLKKLRAHLAEKRREEEGEA
jgi:hypothetical protein